MRVSWTTWLAISLWTMSMLLIGCILILVYVSGSQNEFDLIEFELVEGVLFTLAFISLASVGALLGTHRPGNPIGWIFLTAALSLGIYAIADLYAAYIIETAPGALPEFTLLFWFGAWTWIPAFLLPLTFGILLFPTGQLPSRRWRPFAWLIAGCLLLWALAEMLSPGPLNEQGKYPQITNPIAIESMSGVFDTILTYDELVGFILLIGSVASIFVRLRGASDLERRQIKWFAFAVAFVLIGAGINLALGGGGGVFQDSINIGFIFLLLTIAFIPIAIGIAILRHNLYDIDRLINRTAVYGSLTVLLLLSFFGSVILFQFLLDPLTGGNDLAVAGSTLLVAALFRPVRDRLQRFVDRRFYRRKYDARQTLQGFSITARDAVQLDELTVGLTDVVIRTVQPEHVSIWLRRAVPEEL